MHQGLPDNDLPLTSLIVRDGVLPRVKTFCVGDYDVGTPDELICKAPDLEGVVRNFERLSTGPNPRHGVPVAKGHAKLVGTLHDELKMTDQPAIGWVDRCWFEAPFLFTSWRDITDEAAQQINSGEYRYPSAEFYLDPSQGNLDGTGWVLRRVVILGAFPPRNKQLGRLGYAGVQQFADLRFKGTKRYFLPTGRLAFIRCFSEGAGMDRASMTTALLSAGWSQEEIDAIKDDAALGVVVAHEVAKASGGATPPPAPEAGTNAESPPSKEEMIAALVAGGADQQALSAMSDADLLAMWQAMQAGATPPADVQASEVTSVPTPTPAPGGAAPQRLPTQIIHKFSDAYIDKLVQVKVDRALAVHTAGDKTTRVDAICTQLVKEGRRTPAEVAKADTAKKTPAGRVRQALERANHIKQFGEGESQLETLAAAFLSGPVLKSFTEQIPNEKEQVNPSRRKALMESTPEGRAALRAEKK